MQATIGARLRIHGTKVGDPTQEGEIIEVHGSHGAPPYLVRFEDGHEGLVVPGPDCEVVESGADPHH